MKVKDLIKKLAEFDMEDDVFIPYVDGDVYYDEIYTVRFSLMREDGSEIFDDENSDGVDFKGVIIS